MYKQLLLVFLLAPLCLAVDASPRLSYTGATPLNALLGRQSSGNCGLENVCEDACSPVGSNCCNDGSSTYCPAGDKCVTDGCCPIGKTCSGGGGTITYINYGTATGTGSGSSPSATGGSDDFDTASFGKSLSSAMQSLSDFLNTASGLAGSATTEGSSSPTGVSGGGSVGSGISAVSSATSTKKVATLETATQTGSAAVATSSSASDGGSVMRVLDGRAVFGGVAFGMAALML